MKTKWMKEMKTTLNLAKLEKMRRIPLSLLNNRSISFTFCTRHGCIPNATNDSP